MRLQSDPSALALLALGSVGRDVHRLDEHSDLDFFVITDDKRRLLEDVSWLGSPIEWLHRNTRDGYKALVAGIYHEFAVLTPEELPGSLSPQAGGVGQASLRREPSDTRDVATTLGAMARG